MFTDPFLNIYSIIQSGQRVKLFCYESLKYLDIFVNVKVKVANATVYNQIERPHQLCTELMLFLMFNTGGQQMTVNPSGQRMVFVYSSA